jgi:hypothetical protein
MSFLLIAAAVLLAYSPPTFTSTVFAHDSLTADTTSFVRAGKDSFGSPYSASTYPLDIEAIARFPERNIEHMVAIVPGVIMLDNTLFFRGGRSDETGSYLDGFSITDIVNGGRGITLSQDALYNIDIRTGNYSVGAGRGNSGVVNYSTRTGRPDISASLEYVTDNVTAAGKGKAFNGSKRLGAYWYGYNEIIATLGGPVVDSRIRFFSSINYSYQRDRNPQRYPGIHLGLVVYPYYRDTVDLRYPAGPLLKNSLEQTTWTGNLLFDLDGLLVKFTGTTTHREFYNPFNNARFPGNIANMLNTDRIERVRANNTLLGIKASYLLNPQMSMEVSGSYARQGGKACDPYLEDNFLRYGDSAANAAAGFTWPGRYQTPDLKILYNFSFRSPGDLVANYEKYKNESLTLGSRFSLEMFNRHKLEVGGEVQSFTIRKYSISNARLLSLARNIDENSILPEGDPNKSTPAQILRRRGVNNFGYDVFGNETDAAGIDAPRSPVFASVYVQDSFTARGLIMNVGLRYDHFNADNLTLLDPAHPELTVDQRTGTIMESGLRKTRSSNILSPRIGALHLIDSQSALHSQFGKYVQQPKLQEMYWGVNAAIENMLIDGIPDYQFAFDLKPTRTTLYELGYSYHFDDLTLVDLTGYYKQMNDLVIFDYQATGGRFGSLRNGGRSIAKGVELTFSMQRRKRVRVDACLALQDVRGPGSFPTSNLGSGPIAIGDTTIFILQQLTSYSRVEASNLIRGNIFFDYRFGVDDGGALLEQLGASILLTFNSGHPYTRYRVNSGVERDPRQRIPIEGINSSTTPWVFQVDIHVDKTLNIIDKLNANVYISVINLFDARNVQNVFLTTGEPDDDGWLSDPQYGGQWIKSFGQTYADVYKAINIDYLEQYQNGIWPGGTPSIYGPPRQIRFGVKLEY